MSADQMQAMMLQMKEFQQFMQQQTAANLTAEQSREVFVERKEEKTKKTGQKKTPRAQKTAALTGSEAPFPSISTKFSDDPTMNLMLSLKLQTLVYKWKVLLLLLLRIKKAVNMKGKKWKRNPRWIMAMQGRHIASMWGHLGAARQLCFRSRSYRKRAFG